ncbi:MAG: hypothetical protein ACFB11_00685 [Paracoccaceae bacterium]
MTERLNLAPTIRRARSAIDKIDRYGHRGITLCSMDEIEAMAIVAATSGLMAPQPTLKEMPNDGV